MYGVYHDSVTLVFWMLLKHLAVDVRIGAQAHENIWVTLVQTQQQPNVWLSMGSASNPLAMCLVGIPLKPSEYSYTGKKPNPG